MEELEKYATILGKDLSKFFYLVKPQECSHEKVEDVPYYFSEVFPLFMGLVFAEYVLLAMKGESPRLGESINSLGHGIISESVKIVTMGLEISLYIFIHQNYKLIDLPWDNPLTWYVALIGVDFAYYWAHRASHEVNFLWALHQIHHSSEDFNMAVSVRHPITHNWINSIFYLPLALIVPPPQCLAHQQLNLLYQAYIHSPLVGNLGPLEYILNTPSHHKVHHGCNINVLDKNYGGLLIIWDRAFGTFKEVEEKEENGLVFGTVFQHKSHNPLWQMYYRWPALLHWAKIQSCWADSFKAIFYGPSWVPNAPRLGRDSDKVDIRHRPKFRVELPKWLQGYILFHFGIVCLVFQEFALKKGKLEGMSVAVTVAYLLITLTSIGLLSELNPLGSYFELLRCVSFFLLSPQHHFLLKGVGKFYFIPSAALWLIYIISQQTPVNKRGEKGLCHNNNNQKDVSGENTEQPKSFNWQGLENIKNKLTDSGNKYFVNSKTCIDQRKLN